MPDQDQQTPSPDQQLPAGSLPGSAFQPAPVDAGQRSLPGYFFSLPPDAQRDYLANPNKLPRDLPERTLKTAGRAAPAIGATAAVMATPFLPEFTIPYLGAGMTSYLTGVGAAYLGGAGGSVVQSEIYKGINDPDAPKSWKETFERAGIEGYDQAKTEAGWGAVGRGVGTVLERTFAPRLAYQRLLKPPAGRGQKISGDIVQTGLEEGIRLTEAGAEKLSATIEKVNQDIENMISSSPANIPASKYVQNIEKRMDILRKKYQKGAITGGTKGASVATIDEAEKRFLINHGNVKPVRVFKGRDAKGNPIYKLLDPEDMTLADLRARANPMSTGTAQAIKKQTYEELRTLYKAKGQMVNIPGWSPGTHPDVATEAVQEITRALREELGNIYPGLHQLNARDGRLLDLDESVNRFVNRELNKGLYRWGAALLSGGGLTGALHLGAGAGNPEQWAGMLGAALVKGAIDDPAIGSYLAIALHGAERTIGKVPGGRKIVTALAREALPMYGRKQRYERAKAGEQEQPWVPGEAGPAAEATPAAETAPAPPEDTTRPPLKPADQAVLDREQQMNLSPTYGWSSQEERMLQDASQRVGVPLALLHVLAEREDSGHAGEQQKVPARMVRSGAGAVGLMQIMPDTARTYGYKPEDMTDPYKNIDVAAQFAKDLNNRPEYRGRPGLILAAYNAGEGKVKQAGYRLRNMSPETREYVLQGLKRWAQLSLPPEQAEWFIANTIPNMEIFQ